MIYGTDFGKNSARGANLGFVLNIMIDYNATMTSSNLKGFFIRQTVI